MPFPFILAAAAVGAALSIAASSENNKNVKRANAINQKALNDQITESRLAAYDQTNQLGQNSTKSIGSFYNTIGGTGTSVNSVIASQYRDAAYDQENIIQNQKYQELSLENQKKSSAAGATSQLQNPAISGLQGGISGASAGASLESSLSGAARASAINDAFQNATPAQAQALIAGVPPEALGNPAVTTFYDNQQQLQNLGLQQSQMNLMNARAGFAYSLFGLNRSYNRYGGR